MVKLDNHVILFPTQESPGKIRRKEETMNVQLLRDA